MFQYLRKAVAGNYAKEARDNLVQDEYRKKKLKENLALQIKKLQKAHVENNPVIERNDEDALNVCYALEGIFLHQCINYSSLLANVNLKTMFVEGIKTTEEDALNLSFWELLKEVTHKNVVAQLKHLVVTTDIGLCRAWIRLALNDGLILSYVDAIITNKSQLRKLYSPNAFLMDNELPYILKELLQGLMQFEFRLNYNSSKLNTWDVIPLTLAGVLAPNNRKDIFSNLSRQTSNESPTARLKDVQEKIDSEIMTPAVQSNKILRDEGLAVNTQMVVDTHNSFIDDKTPSVLGDKPPAQLCHTFSPVNSVNLLSPTSTIAKDEPDYGTNDVQQEKNVMKTEHVIPQCLVKEVQTHESPTREADVQKDVSADDEIDNVNGKQSFPVSNRLAGNGWSGWSSAFEHTKTEESSDVSDIIQKTESFGSLLQIYGTSKIVKELSPVSKMSDETDAPSTSGIKLKDEPNAKDEESSSEAISPSQSDQTLQQMDYEVVPMSISLQRQYVDRKTESSLNQLTKFGQEQGLDGQSFRCKQCRKAIGLIYGPYRVCNFDGGYYCYDCHNDEEHIIPSHVIQNWDFKCYKVSKYNNVFLLKVEEEPIFHIDENNPYLYDFVLELKEVKILRNQLQHIKEYVQTCRHEVAEDFRIRLWPREYMCDDVHQYSLLDLVQVHNGQLAHHLKKIISQFSNHIYECTLCRQKGFICEYCHDNTIIYPFQINKTVQCPGCLATFHRKCRRDKRCPKCVRIHLRHSDKNDVDHRLSVTQRDGYTANGIL